jgi:outer membrane lipoprotein LolB
LRRRALFILLITGSVLSACATTDAGRDLPGMASWEARKATLSETNEWEFAGRIGVSAGEDGFNGKIWWRQDGVVFRARLSGPIGVGTIFINGDHRELTLTEQDGTVTELEDAEIDLRLRYGWTIPVTSLRYWTLGIPDPSVPSEVQFNADGLMDRLDQPPWVVTIGRYGEGGGQPMPSRLTAESGDIRVRLVIDDWTFR